MPQICYFYGITIYIQFLDHNPPHIHAVYQSFKAQYSIEIAAKVCGGKYKIVNTSNQVSGDDKSTSSTTSLLVKCEK